jgi:hypothetical protein
MNFKFSVSTRPAQPPYLARRDQGSDSDTGPSRACMTHVYLALTLSALENISNGADAVVNVPGVDGPKTAL